MKKFNKKEKFILIVISLILLLVRFIWINKMSSDYIDFLKPWVEQIKNLCGFLALKYNVGDYNVPYLVILLFTIYVFKLFNKNGCDKVVDFRT